jgi:hypothetical protein
MTTPDGLSPIYAADLRHLVGASFRAGPIDLLSVPARGSLHERIATARDPEKICRIAYPGRPGAEPEGEVLISFAKYWELAVIQSAFVVPVLLGIAGTDVSIRDRVQAERRVLRRWAGPLDRVPCPPDLIRVVRHVGVCHAPGFLGWVERAQAELMGAQDIFDALRRRSVLRVSALRHGASGRWSEGVVSAAELMTDVFVFCRAAAEDVHNAIAMSESHGGSVSRALAAFDEAQRLIFEVALPHLIKPAVLDSDIPDNERDLIQDFAEARVRRTHPGLIRSASASADPLPTSRDVRVTARPHRAGAASPGRTPATPAPEPPAKAYERLKTELATKVFGQERLISQLSLLGVAHLHGLHERVLLVGPSGGGKTHSCRSLAAALGRPFYAVSATDITSVGFKAADMSEVLTALADSGGLDGSVLFIDEIDKWAITPGATGNSLQAQTSVMSSALQLLDGQMVTPENGRDQLDTSKMLILCAGAFGDRFTTRPPTTKELVDMGLIREIANRLAYRLLVAPPGPADRIELLRRSDRSVAKRLAPLAQALGMELIVPEEVFAYVAERWGRDGTDFRTASQWILTAAHDRLVRALEEGQQGTVVLAPDDIPRQE